MEGAGEGRAGTTGQPLEKRGRGRCLIRKLGSGRHIPGCQKRGLTHLITGKVRMGELIELYSVGRLSV